MRIGVVQWARSDGIAHGIANTLTRMGHEIVCFAHDAPLPQGVDIVIAHGPLGSLVPLGNQLQLVPRSRCPAFVLWLTEGFPNPSLPEWIRYPLAMVRSRAERQIFHQDAEGEWKLDSRWRRLAATASRFRYYGDLHWFRQQGIPFVLAVGSEWNAGFLRAHGLDATVAYLGFDPSWQADLGLERDIPVLWIGKLTSHHRGGLFTRVRAELRDRGIEILVIDGVENPFVFGEARTILLNRTKIVLNIPRTRWDNNGIRYYLAAPNRALIVTEPMLPHTPLIPGVHLVEAPPEQLPDTICYYLIHAEERERIVEQAYQLVTTELTMDKGCGRVLEKANTVRKQACRARVPGAPSCRRNPMKAIVYTEYGSPDVLRLKEVETPAPKDNEVRIRVHAASVNSWDWDLLRGTPFLNRLGGGLLAPKYKILGADIAGRVETAGRNAKLFQPGDEVFGDISGCGWGGFAEYVCVPEHAWR